MEETHRAEQRILGELTSRGGSPSTSWLHAVAEAMQRVVEERAVILIDALRKALIAKPPSDFSEATVVATTNFVMADLGRYYMHGTGEIRHVAGVIMYVDGAIPDLRRHQDQLRQRIAGEIEVLLSQMEANPNRGNIPALPKNARHVFVVHGRNQQHQAMVSGAISSFDLIPVILHEQPNKGRTIIEKFEDHSNVGFAVVILSGDDVAGLRSDVAPVLSPRPRQNVILEFGFFLGRLGRKNVCALYETGVELPSDYDGVLWLPLDSSGVWREKLRLELKAAGLLSD